MSGTVRGRIGYAFDNWLPYLTGGFAWSVNQALIVPPDTLASAVEDIFPIENRFLMRFGWTIGAGVEVPFAPNWSAKIEYLYVDLSNSQFITTGASNGYRFGAVRAGVNYHFS